MSFENSVGNRVDVGYSNLLSCLNLDVCHKEQAYFSVGTPRADCYISVPSDRFRVVIHDNPFKAEHSAGEYIGAVFTVMAGLALFVNRLAKADLASRQYYS